MRKIIVFLTVAFFGTVTFAQEQDFTQFNRQTEPLNGEIGLENLDHQSVKLFNAFMLNQQVEFSDKEYNYMIADDVKIEDISFSNEYYSTPLHMITSDSVFISFVNEGSSSVFNVKVSCDVTTPSDMYTQVVDYDVVDNGVVNTAAFSLDKTEIGIYSVSGINISYNNTKSVVFNDTINFEVTENRLSRNDLFPSGLYYYGIGDIGLGHDTNDIGTSFQIPISDTLTAIIFKPYPTYLAGDKFFGFIRDAETDEIIGRTKIVIPPRGNVIKSYRLEMESPVVLRADKEYLMEVSTIQVTGNGERTIYFSSQPYFTTPFSDYIRTAGEIVKFSSYENFGDYSFAITAEFDFASTVGVNETLASIVSLFPNPATDVLNISNASNSDFLLMDITGKIVATGFIRNDKYTLDLSSFKLGVYVLKLSGAANESKRVIIN